MFEVAGRLNGSPMVERAGATRRIVLVDDHLLFAEAMAFALTKADLSVLGMARCGEEAVRLVASTHPDVVLLDLRLPDRRGIEVGEEIIATVPGVRVIGMSVAEDRMTIRALRRAGFHGFIPKSAHVPNVVEALRSNDPEASWLSTPGSLQGPSPDPSPQGLTPRESEVLGLLIEGRSASVIAEKLGIATNTARSHIQNILAKLHVRTRLEAVAVVTGAHG